KDLAIYPNAITPPFWPFAPSKPAALVSCGSVSEILAGRNGVRMDVSSPCAPPALETGKESTALTCRPGSLPRWSWVTVVHLGSYQHSPSAAPGGRRVVDLVTTAATLRAGT